MASTHAPKSGDTAFVAPLQIRNCVAAASVKPPPDSKVGQAAPSVRRYTRLPERITSPPVDSVPFFISTIMFVAANVPPQVNVPLVRLMKFAAGLLPEATRLPDTWKAKPGAWKTKPPSSMKKSPA